MKPISLVCIFAALFGALGCGNKCGDKCVQVEALPPLAVKEGCQPLLANTDAGVDCLLPYPSDFFRVPDATLPSGFRLDTGVAQPVPGRPLNTDVNFQFPIDGASEIPTLVTFFPEPVSASGFAGLLDDPAKSTQASSNVLIIEADTGKLVAHFVDLDPRATDPSRQAIVIHVIEGLKEKTRYVVAIHGVTHPDGSPVSAPEGFRRLRDGQVVGDVALGDLAAHFSNDIFPVIKKAGIETSQLQMAWDFTVGSDARRRGDMLQVRALTLAWLAQNTPAVAITQVTPTPDADTWLQVQGTVTGPMFLESTEPEAKLHRDASNQVAQNGTVDFPFTAEVPVSVRDQYGPGLAMAYGHGFFGKRDEVTYDSTRNVAEDLHAVLFGIDWWGMSFPDAVPLAANLVDHPYKALDLADRVHQGMANWLVMTAAMRGPLREVAPFTRPASGPGFEAAPDGGSNVGDAIYGTEAVYFGISQGHILGGTMTALNPDFHRIVLQMGGVGFTHMMSRAEPFNSFLGFADQAFPDKLEEAKYLATLQPQFDRFDPATYAPLVVQQPLPETPADRRVLLQNGLGDDEVPNLGTFLDARMLGIPLATPAPTSVYGLDEASMPVAGSGLALYDFGISLEAQYGSAIPGTVENGVHEQLRQEPSALAQMAEFYANGDIANFCDGGPCVLPCPAPADAGVCR